MVRANGLNHWPATPYMKPARDPYTLSTCARFDSMPHECEHNLGR